MSKESRKNKLDNAIREYFSEAVEEGHLGEGGIVIGWTVALAISRYDEDGEKDGLIVEQSPGMNNFMAAGLAVAASGAFENQMFGAED